MRNEMLGKASKFEDSELSYEWPIREKPQGGGDSAPTTVIGLTRAA